MAESKGVPMATYTDPLKSRHAVPRMLPAYYTTYYKVATFELELRKCTLQTRLALQSRDCRTGAAEVHFTYYSCATKLRRPSWSCGSVLRVRHLYYKVVAGRSFEYYTCTTKLRFPSWSCKSVLRVLHLRWKDAIPELELRECTPRTTLRYKVAMSDALRLYCKVAIFELKSTSHTTRAKVRLPNWSCGSVLCLLRLQLQSVFSGWSCERFLRLLHLYYKAVIFELELVADG